MADPVRLRFIGGMRTFWKRNATPSPWSMGVNATWPLAELVLDRESRIVRVGLRIGFLRVAIRGWNAPLDSVSAEAYTGSFGSGILMRAPEQPSVIFWCSSATQARLLGALGVHS